MFAVLVPAFVLGFVASRVHLPPLVGYLIAGFALFAFGVEAPSGLETISDTGVLLLLFGIGLKLKPATLGRPVIWAGATLHMGATILVIAGLFLGLGALGFPLLNDLSISEAALIGFAFSFSSTVFTVKALEERNEASGIHGSIALGVLVVQDIFAVLFLTFAVDKAPSLWAIPVVAAIILARPVYSWLLDRSGHGELLLLLGLTLALGLGAEVFELVGLKADLGALIVGFTLANHPRASELADILLGFKDILLIGFFLSIGLGGTPGTAELAIALLAMVALPLKTAGFTWLTSRFHYRARTSWLSAISLTTFSEFGLIVAVVGVEREDSRPRWSTAIAVAVALSFVFASPLNTARYRIYGRYLEPLHRLERDPIQPGDGADRRSRSENHGVRHGPHRHWRVRRARHPARRCGYGHRSS